MRSEKQRDTPASLSVIIPAHNEEKYIASCLEAVLVEVATQAGRGRFEVLVVDNASSDRTAEIARRYPEVRVVEEPNKGLTRARQRGLQEARGGVLA